MRTRPHPTEIITAIENIRKRKEAAGVIPTHAQRIKDIFKEFKQHPTSDIDKVLRELKNAGRIEAGRTINDTWIQAK